MVGDLQKILKPHYKGRLFLLPLFLYNNAQAMGLEQESSLGAQLGIDLISGLSVLQTFLIMFAYLHEFFLMAVIFRFVIRTCFISIKKTQKHCKLTGCF